ncbi:hypothetical protein DL766_009533 [Monosporascus sp. MC13-8B]|nr:hypothetical protein DL763_006886 [Monosporascus cannonballus]RYP14938.1 hypothetical protein DL766_009533 [Monosporascus sp. MC13-8B]
MANPDEPPPSNVKPPSQPIHTISSTNNSVHAKEQNTPMTAGDVQEFDDFGLPIRRYVNPELPAGNEGESSSAYGVGGDESRTHEAVASNSEEKQGSSPGYPERKGAEGEEEELEVPTHQRKLNKALADNSDRDVFQDASSTPVPERAAEVTSKEIEEPQTPVPPQIENRSRDEPSPAAEVLPNGPVPSENTEASKTTKRRSTLDSDTRAISGPSIEEVASSKQDEQAEKAAAAQHTRNISIASSAKGISEFSHQQVAAPKEVEKDDDGEWQTMPAYAPYDIYDDDNRLIAKEHNAEEDEKYGYAGLGGAGKGYTRVLDDDDAESVTSMDDNTRYLFNNVKTTSIAGADEEQRDAVSQLQATKDLLTEGQRIAYVGVTRLELVEMVKAAEAMDGPKKVKREVQTAAEAMKMWSQKIMIRLYAHMEINQAEQVMIEQLAEHGVMPRDLTPVLMQNARVKNPMAGKSGRSTPSMSSLASPRQSISISEPVSPAPPPYESHNDGDWPEVKSPSQLPRTAKIEIDLRWTVLCDLFLVLIADSVYDARSRVLLERVAKDLEVDWIDICKFEKRVTDALEMQQQAEKENWNEEEHLENRRKMALKRRYLMMGLATVGGGLVIGLSAGLMAPLIGAGLATGFTAIGVGGTSSFLAGAGGAAIITSGAAASGSYMGGKAANRRTGAVRTFEYRPLHNNKRVNLIVTISGWLSSKHDDIRLPFSTVDPIMGDIYSILWEPEMLTSMGDTINILATEAVTQSLQQVLGATVLMGLMAALQLPIVLSKLAYLVDNPWAVSLDRAWSAGLILADSLVDRNLGTRPITLVGYSLGSRVIFSCLLELARKGAYGLVQNVYMFGSPIVVKKEEYLKCRTVVSGRWVNGYNRTDWILGYLFRLTNGGIRRVAGLAAIEDIPGLENKDCTEFVVGHMEYRTAMPRLLRECGWVVESDEFVEIEDPDPENHQERQREIINEIEEARKQLEKEESSKKGGGWGIFGRKKKAARAEWEVYEDNRGPAGGDPTRTEDKHGNNHGVLFDVDAIRAELASDELQAKELQSTLPPMKLAVEQPQASYNDDSNNPRDSLRGTKSADAALATRQRLSQERPPAYAADQSSSSSAWGNPADDEIQMTFDTSFDDSAPARVRDTDRDRDAPYYYTSHSNNSSGPLRAGAASPPSPGRPEISRSANTAPNVALADPWADLDDEDFGKEKEISLTFA